MSDLVGNPEDLLPFIAAQNMSVKYLLNFRHNGLSPKVILKKNKHEMAGCNVEKAYTFKDVYTHVYPMVTYLGPYAHCDPVLLIKLIRIGKTYMKMVM